MAKKFPTTRPAVPPSTPVASSPVRNSAIPKAQSAIRPTNAPKAVTYEMIAKRAYEISQSPQCRSEFENWIRAERELKGK